MMCYVFKNRLNILNKQTNKQTNENELLLL